MGHTWKKGFTRLLHLSLHDSMDDETFCEENSSLETVPTLEAYSFYFCMKMSNFSESVQTCVDKYD